MKIFSNFQKGSIVLDYIFQRVIVWSEVYALEIETDKRPNRIDKSLMLKQAPNFIRSCFNNCIKNETELTFFQFQQRTQIKIHGAKTKQIEFTITGWNKINKDLIYPFLNTEPENEFLLREQINKLLQKNSELQKELQIFKEVKESLKIFKKLLNQI